MTVAAARPTLASSDAQPWWMVVLKAASLLLTTMFSRWAERRLTAGCRTGLASTAPGHSGYAGHTRTGSSWRSRRTSSPAARQRAVLAGPGHRHDHSLAPPE